MNNMSENQGQGKVDMHCMAMPKSQYEFISKNQQLAQITGMAIVAINKMQQQIDEIKKYGTDPEYMKKYMVEGTKEQLEEFLKTAFDRAQTGIVSLDSIPEEVAVEFQKQMGDNMLTTELN